MIAHVFTEYEIALLLVAPLILGVFIAKQAVRSKLVATLLTKRSPLATEVSDWTNTGGYWWAVKNEFIWGKSSAALRSIPEVAWSVPVLRVLLVAQVALQVTLVGLFYLVFMHGR
jgi:hypothetical protein